MRNQSIGQALLLGSIIVIFALAGFLLRLSEIPSLLTAAPVDRPVTGVIPEPYISLRGVWETSPQEAIIVQTDQRPDDTGIRVTYPPRDHDILRVRSETIRSALACGRPTEKTPVDGCELMLHWDSDDFGLSVSLGPRSRSVCSEGGKAAQEYSLVSRSKSLTREDLYQGVHLPEWTAYRASLSTTHDPARQPGAALFTRDGIVYFGCFDYPEASRFLGCSGADASYAVHYSLQADGDVLYWLEEG